MNEEFLRILKDFAHEVAPDYPNIKNTDDPYELLWAIRGSYTGVNQANEDLHRAFQVVRQKYNWSDSDWLQFWSKFQQISS